MAATGVPYGQLGPLRLALAEAERTDESNVDQAILRFVEMRPGDQEVLKAKRHHLLTGRRGTGKSTLLGVVLQALRGEKTPVAFIDMEKFKGRPFPDVLIEILMTLLDEVRPPIRWGSPIRDAQLRLEFNRSRKQLGQLLTDPQSTTKQLERDRKKSRVGKIGSGGQLKSPLSPLADASLGARGAAAKSSSEHELVHAQFEELKIERLQQLASRLSIDLARLVKNSEGDRAVVFMDDFYYVRLDDQPNVLDYLQQVVKGTGIWMKVCGVGARLRPYRGGDPPIGMQPEQDMNTLSLDVTLDDFGTAQRFLELMVDGVLEPLGLSARQLMTDTARNRMVLACGGAVARDYLTLTTAALDAAVERLSKQAAPTEQTLVRIEAEDVNAAARNRMNKKEQNDLELDAGADAEQLRSRWRDICEFARKQGNTAFILVRQEDLDKASWGDEIAQLENLRLLHRIKDAVPNTTNWRGVKCVVYMVDLGQVAHQRLRASIPNFWQSTQEFDKLRRAEWVYAPSWKGLLAQKEQRAKERISAAAEGGSPRPITEPEFDSPTLFDDPSDIEQTY